MKYTPLLLVAVLGLTLAVNPVPAHAGDCFQDPIYEHDWTGTVTTGARVRDVACMEGSVVMTTLPVGTKVSIIGETDGWYKVKTADGTKGWVGQWLLAVSESPANLTVTKTETTTTETKTVSTTDGTLISRVKGRILLQVEKNGEAWYVHPDKLKRYYMKDGPTAYQMMRAFGLGISNADLKKAKNGDAELLKRLKGRILLQVESKGEAYYVNPVDGKLTYLKDGAAAYELMRKLSLGIKNRDLDTIPTAELKY